jgi:predicted alpha/beta hydrolase family esterase
MPNWDFPRRTPWVEALDRAIREANETAPPLLVAHSLGCMAVLHWSEAYRLPVTAAFLVAPRDVEQPGASDLYSEFKPIPHHTLPFPSRVVASSDDPYTTLARAKAFAEAWGSRFTDLGPRGHINTASGFGPWPRGEALLADLAL